MDESKKIELLGQAKLIYNSALERMPGLEKWSKSFGNGEQAIFARQFYEFVRIKNIHPATRVFSIDNFLFRDFLDYLSSGP